MANIIMSLAISLDGYITDANGKYNWISGDGSNINTTIGRKNDFDKMIEDIDTIIMGYICYEEKMNEQFKDKKIVVVTRKEIENHDDIIYLSPEEVLNYSKNTNENIFLFGGGITIKPFIEEDLINEYEIGIVPVILGKGRKLFYEMYKKIDLQLTDVNIEDGITILRYKKELYSSFLILKKQNNK